MLEARAHEHIKLLLKRDSLVWPHNLTLSRLVARSLRRHDKSLLQLEIANIDSWWIGLLVPLCLESSNTVLVLSQREKRRLLQVELPRLKHEGFHFSCWEGVSPPPEDSIWLMDHREFMNALENGYLASKQLIFSEAEFLTTRLRDAMLIEICQENWEQLRRTYPSIDSALLDIYQRLSKRLFTQATRENDQVSIDINETMALRDLLAILGPLQAPWPKVLKAINQDWASWAKLNHKTLDWDWYLKPLEPFKMIEKLLSDSPFIMLTGSGQNNLLLKELESIACPIDVSVTVGGPVHQEPIQLFVPLRQPLPNTSYYSDHLLDQCRRLILGQSQITILLLDDDQLRRKLASELAAEFGLRVVHQSTTPESNGVICCSSAWWMSCQDQLPLPGQLIIAILPFPSLESPLISARVNAFKKQGRDWFRDLLLPDVVNILPRIIEPVRCNQGRVAVLDGRLRSRSWGTVLFKALQPWTPIDRLLPH
tara:strand:+ start:27068 stop:28513 length:1446 start_codon:yes stop_codon:yes gene_type:complete